MPATKTKSPALAPRLHVPSALIATGGLSVLTPFGEGACAKPTLDAMAIAVMQGKASRGNIWAPHLERLFDPPRRMSAGANGNSVPAPIPYTSSINRRFGRSPPGTHAGQAASFWVEPSARRRAGVGLQKKRCREDPR